MMFSFLYRGLRERLLADPSFLIKLGIEVCPLNMIRP